MTKRDELIALDPAGLEAAVRECARITAPEISDVEYERIKADNSPRYQNTRAEMERTLRAYLNAARSQPNVQPALEAPAAGSNFDGYDVRFHENVLGQLGATTKSDGGAPMTPDPIRAALNGLRILINEYDPNNSDWFFRKGCMLELLLDIAIALPIGVPVTGDPETTLLRIISDILEKTGLSAKPMRLSDLGDAIVAEMERRVAAETSTLKMALHDVTDGITAACNEGETPYHDAP